MDKNLQRKYWIDAMMKIANPVLISLSNKTLKQDMPVVQYDFDRRPYAHLEAFGRTFEGIAPWLGCKNLTDDEENLRKKYENICIACIDNATEPSSPDFMNFNSGLQAQPLVDTAFLAHGLVRVGADFINKLNDRVKSNIISALKSSRIIIPGQSNWLLFSAMVETALYLLGDAEYDLLRIKYAIRQFMQWYKGDSIYGDGAPLHVDYYNSFVIVPMLADITNVFSCKDEEIKNLQPTIMDRASRYATLLERLISPEGTYPIIGRSITYRFGAFQLLSQACLQKFLNENIKPAQVRCALTEVMKKMLDIPEMFDENGWLRHGVYGYQPGLGEQYICTGSLYLCCAVFLPLGLAPEEEFWEGENEMWTSQKVLAGQDLMYDHSIQN